MAKNETLQEIPTESIRRNPDNPRLFFREIQIQPLQQSIRSIGIQVPLSVFSNGDGTYTLIDGERRWRCALKLNRRTVPAIIQPKPSH
jgi:ParB family transcriptional regulator, chromosome partitioning protein